MADSNGPTGASRSRPPPPAASGDPSIDPVAVIRQGPHAALAAAAILGIPISASLRFPRWSQRSRAAVRELPTQIRGPAPAWWPLPWLCCALLTG